MPRTISPQNNIYRYRRQKSPILVIRLTEPLESVIAESAGEDEEQFAGGSGSPGGGASADEGPAGSNNAPIGSSASSAAAAIGPASLRMASVGPGGGRRPGGFLAARPHQHHVNFDPEAPPPTTPPPGAHGLGQHMSLLEKPEIDKKVKVSAVATSDGFFIGDLWGCKI